MTIMDLAVPEPGPGQVRVKVVASAVNPADYKVTTGEVKFLHGRRFPMVVGYDVSGTVDALGPGTTGFAQGDEVFGFLAYTGSTKQGAFAEFVVIPAAQLAKKPQDVSHQKAAAAATPGLTALQGMRDDGRLASGGQVLVTGASGGVGSLAIGVARKLQAQVDAVCSTHAVDFVRGLGANLVIDRKKTDPLQAAKGPYDVIFDAAAGYSFTKTRHLLKPAGTYVTTLPSATFALDKVKSLLSSQSCRVVLVKSLPADLELLGRWMSEGLNVPILSTLPVREVTKGIQQMQSGELKGRIVVDVASGF
jgi:NADPH:quinone reductase-like Zn-dependent oxidoreductase